MTICPPETAYKGYYIRNNGIVVRIFRLSKMIWYGAATLEEAKEIVDKHKQTGQV